MTLLIYVLMIIMFFYTVGFAVTLWKDKNKPGSIVVFGLAMTIAIAPFFTLLKN